MIQRISRRLGIELSKLIVRVSDSIQIFGDLDYKNYKLRVYNLVRFYSCYKEPETVEWIESFDKKDIVYDVGAAVGSYSLIMSKYAKEVYAFEPALTNFNLLSKNIIYNLKNNLITNNIIPVNMALSYKTGFGDFNYGSLEEGISNHSFDHTDKRTLGDFTPVLKLRIISSTIDDLVKTCNFPVPNHIKIDVDGNEAEIVEGMKETLNNPNLKSILIEITYANDGNKLIETIESYGFKLIKKSDRNNKYGNHIFMRNKV